MLHTRDVAQNDITQHYSTLATLLDLSPLRMTHGITYG